MLRLLVTLLLLSSFGSERQAERHSQIGQEYWWQLADPRLKPKSLLLLPGATHGLVPYTTIMAVDMLVTTSLIVAAGIITESQAWATAGIFCSSLGINVLGFVFAHLHGISMYMWGTCVQSSSTAWIVLGFELLTVPLLLGATFYIQSRKTDFL